MWSVDPQAYEAHKKAEKKGDNKKHKNVSSVCSPSLWEFLTNGVNATFCYFPSIWFDLGSTAGCVVWTR